MTKTILLVKGNYSETIINLNNVDCIDRTIMSDGTIEVSIFFNGGGKITYYNKEGDAVWEAARRYHPDSMVRYVWNREPDQNQ